ncbi:dnaJ [Symbiodinium pilosum]|uniref:DnaJ protein n=1 Tax=Symbiodinium pilosum TaxID=2952 RepID=A0A812VBL5_SYMPI|nr:dnaJ [Symbiodinium pilosum]
MRIWLCSRTREYRRVAATVVLPGQWVVELGCHEGVTTSLLSKRRPGFVLGVDRSAHAVRTATGRFPQLHFGVADALDSQLHELRENLQNRGATLADVKACFLDLGGDARLSTVLHALANLHCLPHLELLVAKSEELVRLKKQSEMLVQADVGGLCCGAEKVE